VNHQCRFQVPQMSLRDSLFGKPLNFYGAGSVALEETGIVVYGDLPKFTIPFFGRFYSKLLTERTTRTVPYSRIVRQQTTGRWLSFSILKVLFLLLWLSGAGFLFATGIHELDPIIGIPLGFAAFVLIPAVVLVFNRATHYITYRLPSGKRTQFAFRLRPVSRQNMSDFITRLNEYRTAAAAFEQGQSAGATQ